MKRAKFGPDREAKLQRIEHIRRSLPHMSATALTAILKFAAENDVSEFKTYHRSIWDTALAAALEDTPYGPILLQLPVHTNDGEESLWMVNPLGYLHTVYQKPGGFQRLVKDTFFSMPCTPERPWRIVLYTDEVSPGNQLSVANNRKMWLVYFSFLEFGVALHDERAWCPLVAEPSKRVRNIHAGISQIIAVVLKCFNGMTMPHDLATGGIVLTDDTGVQIRVWAKIGMFLQDGGAHKLVFGCKGDAGTRMCMLCSNVVAGASGLTEHDDSDRLVSSDEIRREKLILATDADVKGAIVRLIGHKVTDGATAFLIREKAIGFGYQEHGLLFDAALRHLVNPVSQYCHDWFHCLFAGGVWNHLVFLFFQTIYEPPPRESAWDLFNNYTKLWTWPQQFAFKGAKADLFGPARVKAFKYAKVIKCSASEGLNLSPVLTFFVLSIVMPSGLFRDACTALVALGDLVEVFQASAHAGLVTPQRLRSAVDIVLATTVKAGWREHMIPKFHWLLHFDRHLEHFGKLLTCFVHERKHKLVKRYGEDITNTRSYAKSVLQQIISHQIADVTDASAFNSTTRCVGTLKKAPPALLACVHSTLNTRDEVLACSRVKVPLGFCVVGDVVLFTAKDGINFCAGKLLALASVAGKGEYALVTAMVPEASACEGSAVIWKENDRRLLIGIDLLVKAVIFSSAADTLRTLIPFEFRGLRPVAD